MDNKELEIDELAFEFFNILLPASKIEDSFNNIKELVKSQNIDSVLELNVLKAELYIASLVDANKVLNITSIKDISKILFDDVYSWAGLLKDKKIEPLLKKLLLDIENSIKQNKNVDSSFRLMAFVYNSLLRIAPLNNGNEKLAKLCTNYVAMRFNYPMFDFNPNTEVLEAADQGDLSFLSIFIQEQLNACDSNLKTAALCAAGTVAD